MVNIGPVKNSNNLRSTINFPTIFSSNVVTMPLIRIKFRTKLKVCMSPELQKSVAEKRKCVKINTCLLKTYQIVSQIDNMKLLRREQNLYHLYRYWICVILVLISMPGYGKPLFLNYWEKVVIMCSFLILCSNYQFQRFNSKKKVFIPYFPLIE